MTLSCISKWVGLFFPSVLSSITTINLQSHLLVTWTPFQTHEYADWQIMLPQFLLHPCQRSSLYKLQSILPRLKDKISICDARIFHNEITVTPSLLIPHNREFLLNDIEVMQVFFSSSALKNCFSFISLTRLTSMNPILEPLARTKNSSLSSLPQILGPYSQPISRQPLIQNFCSSTVQILTKKIWWVTVNIKICELDGHGKISFGAQEKVWLSQNFESFQNIKVLSLDPEIKKLPQVAKHVIAP